MREVAEALQCSVRTVRRYAAQGHLKVRRLGPGGRLVRVREEDLRRFLDRGRS